MIREIMRGIGLGMGRIEFPESAPPGSGDLMSAIEEQIQIAEARMRLLEMRQQVLTAQQDEECPK